MWQAAVVLVVIGVVWFFFGREKPTSQYEISREAMDRILAGFGKFHLRDSTYTGWHFVIPVKSNNPEITEWMNLSVFQSSVNGSFISPVQCKELQAAARIEFDKRIAARDSDDE